VLRLISTRILDDHAAAEAVLWEESSPRLPYYICAEDGTVAPIFRTGIFNYDDPGDNEDLCQ